MANLQATSITGGAIFEKIGTNLTSSGTTDLATNEDMFTGSSEATIDAAADWVVESPRVIAMNPHKANQFVVVYSETSGNPQVYARLGIISGRSITWQTAGHNLQNIAANSYTNPMIAFDPNCTNRFVVAYRRTNNSRWYVITGDCSNDALSFGGDDMELGGGNNHWAGIGDIAFDPNVPGRFVVVGYEPYLNSSGGYSMAFQVSSAGLGTTITNGSGVFHDSSGSADNRLAFDPNYTGRFVVVWRDTNASSAGKARAMDLGSSGLSISAAGSTVQFHGATPATRPSIAWDPDQATKFVIAFKRFDGQGVCEVGTITNATGALAFGANKTFGGNAPTNDIAFLPGFPNKFIVTWPEDNTTVGGCRIGIRDLSGSADTISGWMTSNHQIFNTSAITKVGVSSDTINTGVFVIASDEGAGKVIVGKMSLNTVTIDLSTGSFFTLDMQNVGASIDTFTISGTSTGVTTFDLRVIQGSTARQFDWGAITNVKFVNNSSPSGPIVTATNNAVDVYSFTTYDNGTTWYGEIVGQNIS